MSKKLLINKTFNEIRIALLENGEILDYLVTRETLNDDNHPIVGNIYTGKVIRVLPGIQSAFIDIGHKKAAFLYVDDAYIPSLEEQRAMRDQHIQKLSADANDDDDDDKGQGEIIPDEFSTFRKSVHMQFHSDIKIENLLREGDVILVQVSKEPISTKGPKVTRYISLPGCYIVLMPLINHVGVSRRIEDDEERERLRKILEDERKEKEGLIARTMAEGQTSKALKSDHEMLSHIWKEIQEKMANAKPRQIIHKDLSFVERALRDLTDDSVDQIYVDDDAAFKIVEKFIAKYLPNISPEIIRFQNQLPIFEHFDIDLEIERALSNKVFLKSGGYIIIDQTEALVSIDVNTGKFVGKKTFEETILKTNLEAVKEIVYQLRLRNCGGIIIIDFIDMEHEDHRQKVYSSLLEALKKDRAKTNVLPISEFGLVEMTRKRTRDTLTRTMCAPCSYCEGTGKVKSVITICYEIVRKVGKMAKTSSIQKIFLYAHPEVSARLCSDDIDIIELIEKQYKKDIIIRAENNYHFEQYDFHCE
ncbi:MAG: Rne/Rng family ribonuclease [Bacteriovoracales bacterium]|nr:Rne/Rng family ribonuclease [Bacteriovoracales bacterium]